MHMFLPLMSIDAVYVALKIAGALLGGGGILTALYYWKENKKLKQEQVRQSSAETVGKNIKNDISNVELLSMMRNEIGETLKLQNQMSQKMSQMAQPEQIADLINSVKDVKSELNSITVDLKDVQKRQSMMERYLDGPYHAWIESQLKTQQ